jgi:uncharacterized RDD family membrane protein YckC
MASEKIKKSSRLARYAAYILDGLILLPFTIFLRVFKIPFLGWIIVYGYHWISTFLYGQTFGKKLFGLRVVSNNKSKITLGRAFIREVLGRFVSAIIFGLGFIWILFDEKRQGWHDKLADTIVLQEEELKGGKKVFAYIIAFVFPFFLIVTILIALLFVGIGFQKAKQQQILRQQYYLPQQTY